MFLLRVDPPLKKVRDENGVTGRKEGRGRRRRQKQMNRQEWWEEEEGGRKGGKREHHLLSLEGEKAKETKELDLPLSKT